MNETAKLLIANIDSATYTSVARAVLTDPGAKVIGTPTWAEIPAPHGDKRTIAILRVSGKATTSGHETRWSSVVKVIDTSIEGGVTANWVDPRIEEIVYESNHFSDDGLPLRPVRGYLVAKPAPSLKMFWLEDLTDAHRTPFTVSQLKTLLRHVGEFNGYHAQDRADLPFKPATDSYLARWRGYQFHDAAARVARVTDPTILARLHANTPTSVVVELHDALDQLAIQSTKLPHTLSFGDCQPGNLFQLGDETVAIDWASLTMDPTGVDAGCLIGSATTWGKQSVEVAHAEKELFDSYLEGIASSGWTGETKNLRRGFFGQFATYLMLICTMANVVGGEGERDGGRAVLEKRFQTPLEEIPDLLAPIIDLAPKYLEEARSLLKQPDLTR